MAALIHTIEVELFNHVCPFSAIELPMTCVINISKASYNTSLAIDHSDQHGTLASFLSLTHFSIGMYTSSALLHEQRDFSFGVMIADHSKPRLLRTRLHVPRISTYPGQKQWTQTIYIYSNVNEITRMLVTFDTIP